MLQDAPRTPTLMNIQVEFVSSAKLTNDVECKVDNLLVVAPCRLALVRLRLDYVRDVDYVAHLGVVTKISVLQKGNSAAGAHVRTFHLLTERAKFLWGMGVLHQKSLRRLHKDEERRLKNKVMRALGKEREKSW